jgi:cytochrome P450
MANEQKYELYSQSFKSHAYATYAQMRADAPVFQQPGMDGTTPIWFITGFQDVEAVLRDEKTFVLDASNALDPQQLADMFPPQPAVIDFISNHLLTKDGEDHRRLRSLVNKAFTPKIIQQLRGRIQEIADSLLDKVQGLGEMDLIEAYAFPIPITVIAELLGIPSQDREKFRLWSGAFITPDLSEGADERFASLMQDFVAYFTRLFAERRANPQEDLISSLLQAEDAGDQLKENELFSMVILLITAGHETTVNLVGNSTLALLQNPVQLARLKADLSQMPAAIEEFLRFDGPAERAITRWVARDTVLGEKRLHRGDLVIAVIGAADHDPAQFAQPDELNIDRQDNRHLAFGKGVHYCLGAPLARLEGEIALSTLLRRLPNLRLNAQPDQLEWRLVPIIRGLKSLPVAWDAG